MRAVCLLTIGAVGLSCASPPVRLYSGPERLPFEIAQLREASDGRARILAVGGTRVFGSEFHLSPGRHEVWVKATIRSYGGGVVEWSRYCLFAISLEAGSTYEAETGAFYDPSEPLEGVPAIGAIIRESTTHSELRPTECVTERPKLSKLDRVDWLASGR